MALADSSIVVSPGSGETVATSTVNAKKHQVVMVADAGGHIIGSRPRYSFLVPNQVHVASASNPAWDLFNADATAVVRVTSVLQVPDIVTAVTGVTINWLLERTTAVGTGGTALTAWLADLNQTALSANITARSKPSGGATAGIDLRSYALSSEETNAATVMVASLGGLELIPAAHLPQNGGDGIVLRQNQGLRVTQVTSSAVGNTSWLITFLVE